MKRLKLIIICLWVAFCSVAQTQQILVKTKGKIDSTGHVIPGKRLSGVTIKLREVPNTLLTNLDGQCAVHLKDSIYTVLSVHKNGYQLVDNDIIGLQMNYSPNSLIIVMEKPEELREDRLANERKIRKTLQGQLQTKESELDSLRKHNVITQEEYLKKLRQLYADYENNEKRINELAGRYALTDYEQMSELDLEISQSILDGDLSNADSLLKQKGDISERITQLETEGGRNLIFSKESVIRRLKRRDKFNLIKPIPIPGWRKIWKVDTAKQELADDCYRLAELYRLQLEYDSAAYYLERRANLDTLAIEWSLDAGRFIMDNPFDKQNESKAKYYFDRALLCLQDNWSIFNFRNLAKTYMCLGDLNSKWGNYQESSEYYEKALKIYSTQFEKGKPLLIGLLLIDGASGVSPFDAFNTIIFPCTERLALAYNSMKMHDKALESLQRTLSLYKTTPQEYIDLIANCYINIGTTYENMDSFDQAHENYENALAILDSISDMPRLAYCYNNLGSLYDRQEEYENAIESYNNSLDIYQIIYGSTMDKQSDVAYLYNNLASTYYNRANSTDNQLDYNEALDYYLKALHILSFRFDRNHPTVRTIQENIMTTINEMCLK